MFKRFVTLSLLIAVLVSVGTLFAQVTGDPNYAGRLEFTYPNTKIMVKVDGEDLEPTNGLKAVKELSHGKHLVQLFEIKGLFKVEPKGEDRIEIPGGYIVRATLKGEKIVIIDTVPIPGLNLNTQTSQPVAQPLPVVQPQPQASTQQTTTTTTTTNPGLGTENFSVSMGTPAGAVGFNVNLPTMAGPTQVTQQTTVTTSAVAAQPAQPTQMAAPTPEPVLVSERRPSKIVLLSENGMADVYLDGDKKGELPLAMIDEMSKCTIFDVMPGAYLLKVEGFDVWYKGTLTVGSGEEIKIQVEKDSFKIIARTPLY